MEVSLRYRRGPLDLDVGFTLEPAWTALFAPSGAGKTTILRLIAGLERPDHGRLASNARIFVNTSSGVFTPPHRRSIGLVAQRPALFPHLSALKNVLYCMRQPRQALDETLALCRIEHLVDKMPRELSGGERQRVALARAIAANPLRLLMLDEPFTGLDTPLRDGLIQGLRRWAQERKLPVLLVTHDLGEVFAADAHVLKMESGRIVAQGSAAEILAPERDRLLQRLTGS